MLYDSTFAQHFLTIARELGPTFTLDNLVSNGLNVDPSEFPALVSALYQQGLIVGAGVSHNLGIPLPGDGQMSGSVRLRLTLRGQTAPLTAPPLQPIV